MGLLCFVYDGLETGLQSAVHIVRLVLSGCGGCLCLLVGVD